MAALPWWAAKPFGYPPEYATAWLALVALAVVIGVWRIWDCDARALALSATALISAAMLAGALALLPMLNVEPEAAFVKREFHAHVAIAHIAWHNGLFGYTGRLRRPLPWIPRNRVLAWCRAHPNGVLLTSNSSDEPNAAAPFKTWPYFLSGDHRIAAWRASSILAARKHPGDRLRAFDFRVQG